jgi:hypothetical protein
MFYINDDFRYNAETGHLYHARDKGNLIKAGTAVTRKADVNGYLYTYVRRKKVPQHRIIWEMVHGSAPRGVITHLNQNKADNRLVNLAQISRRQVAIKRYRPGANVDTGYPGVERIAGRLDQWRARIKVKGRWIELGTFNDFRRAITARQEAEKKYLKRQLREY